MGGEGVPISVLQVRQQSLQLLVPEWRNTAQCAVWAERYPCSKYTPVALEFRIQGYIMLPSGGQRGIFLGKSPI